MAFERDWAAVAPVALTAQGTRIGNVTVTSVIGFKVKARVTLSDPVLPSIALEVKQVLDDFNMVLGYPGNSMVGADLSLYGTSGPSFVFASKQQKRLPTIPEQEMASYEQEPTNARRVIGVDLLGRPFDSVETSDGKRALVVDAEVTVDTIQLIDKPYDSGITTYPTAVQEVYTTYVGGYSGTPVQQITVNYTDATKGSLSTWQRANWNGSSWVIS